MGEYHAKRAELKGLLTVQFIRDAEERGISTDPDLNKVFAERAGQFIDEHELLAVRHFHGRDSFWWSVWESFVGSFFFALFAGLLWIALIGFHHDPLSTMSDKMSDGSSAHHGDSISHGDGKN